MFKALPPNVKIYIIGGVILLFAVLGIYIYTKGKKKGAVNVNLSAPNTDKGGALASESEIRQLSEQIHSDLDGANFFASHSSDLYNRVLSLSDTDLTRLYNQFNQTYEVESQESLVQWVSDEYAVPGSAWETSKNAMLSRFAKLNFM